MKTTEWKKSLEEISKIVDKTSPLYAYITSNQLSGFEEYHFKEAVSRASTFYNAHGYPNAEVFREALDSRELYSAELENLLSGFYRSLSKDSWSGFSNKRTAG